MGQALTVNQSWAVLSAAILFEVAGTVCMRLSESFTRLTPSVLIFVFYAISFVLNTLVVRTLGLSVVYAVWSGVGTVLMATVFGMALGGWMSGVIFDLTGSYQAAFVNGILWNLLNVGIAVGLLRRPGRPLAQPAG